MKALLIIAHGSRRETANEEVRELARMVELKKEYGFVTAAFLEISEDTIERGVAKCVVNGANSILVFPYFLNSGVHVVTDIPQIVDKLRIKYPDVVITLSPHLGASAMMPDLIVQTANSC